LKLSAVDIRFTRRNYEDIQAKAQVLIQMLSNDKIHPKLAFTHCGMFTDSELAYNDSMKWYKDQEAATLKLLEKDAEHEAIDDDV
jgi:hypothetical protein